MLSAVYRYVLQVFNFAGSSRVANDRAELEERDYLFVLFERHREVH